jgi:hypothetical protein
VLQVESKWPYLPITPTYDQYVQRWVTMPEREGFHLKTRSAMKQLLRLLKSVMKQLLRLLKSREHVGNQMHHPVRDNQRQGHECRIAISHEMVFESMVCAQGDWARFCDVKSASAMSVENNKPVISR